MTSAQTAAGLIVGMTQATKLIGPIWDSLAQEERIAMVRHWEHTIAENPDGATECIVASIANHPHLGAAWRELGGSTQENRAVMIRAVVADSRPALHEPHPEMSKLRELVREALNRSREKRSGSFAHNAAAAELMDHGLDAVTAIEDEISALAPTDRPRDLESVMVVYARLIRALPLGDRYCEFLRRLPPPFRLAGLKGLAIGWQVKDPQRPCGPTALPEALRNYAEEISSSGSEVERSAARRILESFPGAA
jgi:hypothetical protein